MYIRNLTSKKIERPKSRVEVQHQGNSVFRHRSSIQISKGNKASGVIADNHVKFFYFRLSNTFTLQIHHSRQLTFT